MSEEEVQALVLDFILEENTMKKDSFIVVNEDGCCRITTEQDISGFFTGGINTCIVMLAFNSSKMSLMHISSWRITGLSVEYELMQSILDEINWVGNGIHVNFYFNGDKKEFFKYFSKKNENHKGFMKILNDKLDNQYGDITIKRLSLGKETLHIRKGDDRDNPNKNEDKYDYIISYDNDVRVNRMKIKSTISTKK